MEKKTKVLVIVTNGTEDIEATVPIDLFRRANFEVVVAGEKEIVTFARGMKVIPDILFDKIPNESNYDLIFIPGGAKGVENLLQNEKLKELLERQKSKDGWISAICAAPLLLDKFEIIPPNAKITSHPSIKDKFNKYNYRDEEVVIFEKIITSRGAGTSIPLALKIIQLLASKELSDKIARDIVYIR